MIELTEQQRQAIRQQPGKPVQLVDPDTHQTFVLLQQEEYERLTDYDDSPWTDDEMADLAAEAGEMLDNYGKNP
jgi:hypothetical protein